MKIDTEELKARLDKVPCKPRLYPTRIFALQIFTGKKFDELIDKRIVQSLSKITALKGPRIKFEFTSETLNPDQNSFPRDWTRQFISDFATYGLREAVLFFHTYKFLHDPAELIESAVALYHDVAKSYIDNITELEKSKDETIKDLNLAIKMYGEKTPQDVKGWHIPKKQERNKRRKLRCPSKKKLAELAEIAHALDAAGEPMFKLSANEILDEYGIDPKKPETYQEEIVGFIDSEFMFDSFPGFEDGVLRVVEILEEYGVNAESKEGQYVLETYVEHVLEEYYGDFWHVTDCYNCGKEFKPSHSLEYANQVVAQKVFCPDCSSKNKPQKS